MRSFKLLAICLVLVAAPTVALGRPSDQDSALYSGGKCFTIMQTGTVHQGIAPGTCRDMAALDRRLNAAYRSRRASLNTQVAKSALRRSQRDWIASRNATCNFTEPVRIADETDTDCFIVMTTERIAYLVRPSDGCESWQGKYSGNLTAGQSFFGPEKVAVTVDDGMTVQIWNRDRGGFLASGTVRCTKQGLLGKLDTGAGGSGKISASMRRGKAVYLRLWNYDEGRGPNKAGYLPAEKLEIPLRRVANF